MIQKISVEENNVNSKYSALSSKNGIEKNPAFKGGAIVPVLLQGIQACEQNPMINVAVIDMFSAILPRTFVESLTNWFAGFEAFRRESSGLIVNCLIPSFITLGFAKLANKFIMPAKTNLASCWADSNMLDKISNIYEKSTSEDKVKDTIKNVIENIEGTDGKDHKSFKDILTKNEIDDYAQKLKALAEKNQSDKELKKGVSEIVDEMIAKTHIYENIKVNGGTNPVKATNVDTLLQDTVKFLTEYKKADSKLSIAEFAQKGKKLVKTKSLLGLSVVIPLAASMQFINRKITEKLSGTKGAPIYKDYGKEDAVKDEKSKVGLLKQKIISISSMVGVGLLSMMKKPSMNMLEFKGIFPTMDQARIISTVTFASRMAAADDKNELAEATVRDIATFMSLYFLGDYAAKGAATIIEKKTGEKLLNDNKPLKENAGMFEKAWHWFKDVSVKSSKEVVGQKAVNYRAACQAANLGVSLLLLGLIIPIFARKHTEKKHAEAIELAKQNPSLNMDNTGIQSTNNLSQTEQKNGSGTSK